MFAMEEDVGSFQLLSIECREYALYSDFGIITAEQYWDAMYECDPR